MYSKLFLIFSAGLILLAGTFIIVKFKNYSSAQTSITNINSEITSESISEKNDKVLQSAKISLPLSGSAPTANVRHTIPINEIKRGCFRQDCIPSVDNPKFVEASELSSVLDPSSIGIALSYKDEKRFYPFPMLETHELVNDIVAGDPVLISYCPLCGTGIVFDRTLDGKEMSFGVSGMLWQSNLLMYDRAESVEDRNLWSQVLGQAVVGNRAGEKLRVIASDIMRFSDWANLNPNGRVLSTGLPSDPYNGDYFRVAESFSPNFNPDAEAIAPETYVYGLIINGKPIAIVRDDLKEGVQKFQFENSEIIVTVSENRAVSFTDELGNPYTDIEGFWFSWQSAHPDTIVLTKS
jgi:hypothetical protein